MILNGIGLLAVDSSRTRAYIAALAANDMQLQGAILVSNPATAPGRAFPESPYFDNTTPTETSLRSAGVPVRHVSASDVNSDEVCEAVAQSPADVLIYSGPGGTIVRRALLNVGKRLLHVHPGIVPHYRGSTTVYYSLLNENRCGASAIFLNEKIDCGPVLAVRSYPPPPDRRIIDYAYDPFIRADLLVRVLRGYVENGEFVQQPQHESEKGDTYFIMHPVLRHIAVLGGRSAA